MVQFVLNKNKLINNPQIISRGFIYVNNSTELVNEIQKKAIDSFKAYTANHQKINMTSLKKHISNDLTSFIYDLTERKPLIIPIIMEIDKK